MSEKITISGVVEEIVFQNSDNGYTICDISSAEEGLFTATGCMPYITEGESVLLTGEWTEHPTYGEQFRTDYCETVMPSDEEAILKYLSSGIIQGIRAATAKKLLEHFGTEVLDIMLQEPERLAEVKGISKDKAKKIGESYRKLRSVQHVVMFLQQYGISPSIAVKAHNAFGAQAVDLIKKNPYILSETIDGITFKTVDIIAFNLGFAKNDPIRVRSGIKEILKEAAYSSGYTCMPKNILKDHAVYTLNIEEAEADSAITDLLINKEIISDTVSNTSVYYLYRFYKEEYCIARTLRIINSRPQKFIMPENEVSKVLYDIEQENGIKLEAEQKNAVYTAAEAGCMILTGGPGTGKTTTINSIIALLESMKLKIALTAPTGRAAKRMSQVTGREAKTIHRLLGTQISSEGKHSFIHDEGNPLSEDVIILDEASMVDVSLMAAFLKAVKSGARLIISGDADQLPSVGPGNVLADIISSGIIPVIRLTHIFRQAEESLIVVNAHMINRGEIPCITKKDADFFFLKRQNAEKSAETVVDLYKNRLPSAYGLNPITSIQVMSPTKKGPAGTISLNKLIQAHINPHDPLRPEHSYGSIVFRTGDKVMQIRNNYDMPYTQENGEDGMGIYNGDMGIIESIHEGDKYMIITFDEDKTVEYPFTSLEDLDLAYAITVHKSQGSEFPVIIMPVCSFPPMLMCRNLFYTAVTRAKDMVVLVGSERCIEHMTLNDDRKQRFTGLTEKLLEDNENGET